MAAIVKRIAFSLLVEKGIEKNKRYLRFDVNALADFEQEVGMGFSQLMSSRAVFAATRGLLWAGLKHEQRTLTVQMVGGLMQDYIQAGGDVGDLLGAAMKAASEQGALGKPDLPEPEEDDEEGEGDTAEEPKEGEKGDPPSQPDTKEPDSSGTIG